jgi:hypothetical protein
MKRTVSAQGGSAGLIAAPPSNVSRPGKRGRIVPAASAEEQKAGVRSAVAQLSLGTVCRGW